MRFLALARSVHSLGDSENKLQESEQSVDIQQCFPISRVEVYDDFEKKILLLYISTSYIRVFSSSWQGFK